MNLFNTPQSKLPEKLDQAMQGFTAEKTEFSLVNSWVIELWSVLSHLQNLKLIHPSIQFEAPMVAWIENIDHGAQHSFVVYQGIKWLERQEKVAVDDRLLQIMALFHDLGNQLPYLDFETGVSKTGNQYREHPNIMAEFFRQFGTELGLTTSEIEELQVTIEHHDDIFFGKPLFQPMPIAGQLLSDADKIFCLKFSTNGKEILNSILERQLMLSASKLDSWHFIRDDITNEVRDQFQYGDRWLTDKLAVVRQVKRLEFYTQTAKDIGVEMTENFDQVTQNLYGQLYDSYQAIWQQAFKNPRPKIYLVAKGSTGLVKEVVGPGVDLPALVKEAGLRSLELESRYFRPPYKTAKGWNIAVEVDGQLKPVDPSIVRFKTKNEFLDAVLKALSS